MKRIAIVTPWFNKDLKGGAEQQAWQVATRLARRGHQIEVLTTCCRSFQDDWATNHLEAGLNQEQGITIRRFRVERRDRAAFDRINALMLQSPLSTFKLGVNPVSFNEAATFCNENINSQALLNYLKEQHLQYDAFIFLPYLYGPIINGLPLVGDRAFLQPCLHDESYAYLPQVAHIFHAAKSLLFISEGEAQLAKQLYGPGISAKSIVAGAGIEAGLHYDEQINRVGEFLLKEKQFVLCLGRKDATKNTDLLVNAYATFKQQYPNSALNLVIAGPGNFAVDLSIAGLVDLGLVKENEKEALLANCLALFQPSQRESYSRVMMEAWFYQKPVIAHRNCLATAIAVESSQGGWLAETEEEWTEAFAKIDLSTKELRSQYGINGQAYTNKHGAWDRVIENYETALGLNETTVPVVTNNNPQKLEEIHQLLPNLAYGDAISNHALAIRNYLRSSGYKSEIFVRYLDERLVNEAKVFQPKCFSDRAGLIYHHSIGSELTKHVIAHTGEKCLIYHNITPADFFEPYRPEFAKILENGRSELKQLAPFFPRSVGDSAYNSAELAASGFTNPGVLPIIVDPSKWDMPADDELMQQLQDGKSNLLFVGRLAPNKRQDDLVEAFAYYLTMDSEARLILVGSGDPSDPYYCHLISVIKKLNLSDRVILAGQINEAQLLAFYRTAHLFWSMSEHEGFCVPLVEAMWFDIPILAYKSTAVPETLGIAGLMFTNKEDLLQVAALAKILVKDTRLRAKILTAQRKRREAFLPKIAIESLKNIILRMR